MKRFFPTLALVLLAGLALAQQLAEEAFVINIEVPVRVFKGSRFIDDLTINDFEITENGKPQKLEAVYYVKKRSVERRDEIQRFAPRTDRNFFLFFEISDYMPKIGEALDYFIQNVIMPGDGLTIVSPMKTYRLKPRAFEARSREEIVEKIKGILRMDSLIGSSEYRDIIHELEDMAKAMAAGITHQRTSPETATRTRAGTTTGTTTAATAFTQWVVGTEDVAQYSDFGFDEMLNRYAEALGRLDNLRSVDQKQLVNFSKVLKNEQGQKYVYLFYQREFVPKIDPKILYQYIETYQDRPDIAQTVQGLFEFYKRETPFDVNLIKKASADSSVAIHFLLISDPPKSTEGVRFEEQSEDIYSAFSQMAEATGGFTESSANPVYLMKSAVEASENYYLLYYSPRPYVKDGKFREISVRIKNKDYRVVHRLGYYAN
jgi:VWFA-related protein